MWIVWMILHICIVLLLAPLVQGIIKKTKARLQNRRGPGILQPYYDLFKYLKKDAVISREASWLTTATPYISFCAVLTAGLFIPIFAAYAPLGFAGDLLVIIYLFGVVRFFISLTALDGGSSFGGMGASREMALSAIAEPALLLAAFAALFSGGTTHLGSLLHFMAVQGWGWGDPAYVLAFLAMLLVVITETGRIPVDNPDTHLELTMIHEGMLLEYSGRYLGLMMWTAQIKQLLILSLFVDLFLPWGVALQVSLPGILLSLLFFVLKVVVLGILLAVIETLYAKIRLFQVPKLLASSMLLSLLAVFIRAME